MPLKITKPFWQAFSLGVLAGVRTISAPAIASHILLRRNSGNLAKSVLDFMQSEKTAAVLKVLTVAEFIGDKLPSTSNRTKPLGLIFRCLSGSLAGASIYKANGKNALTGALLGSGAALGSTFGSYFLRKSAVSKFNVFDPIIGTIEDVLVMGAGLGLALAD